MARIRTLTRVALAAACLTFVPALASAAPITFTSFTGPLMLTTGMQGTFELAVLLDGVGTTTTVVNGTTTLTTAIGLPTFSFNSGEGETLTTSPLSAPYSGPYTVAATFTFQNPGTYQVSAFGNVSTIITNRWVENIPIYEYFQQCSCYQEVGFQSVVHIDASQRIDSVSNSLSITVSDPPPPPPAEPVGEPATLLLFGPALFGVFGYHRSRAEQLCRASLVSK